jgi:hypothetical protein
MSQSIFTNQNNKKRIKNTQIINNKISKVEEVSFY